MTTHGRRSHRRPTKGYVICPACGRETLSVYERCSHCNHRHARKIFRRIAAIVTGGIAVIGIIILLLH